ncbi:MAG: hypothetical protein ACRDG4_20045, partial [Chloroflexota bacterium]
ARAASAAVLQRTSAPVDGTLLRDAATGKVSIYWAGRLHWIKTRATLDALGYGQARITPLTTAIPEGNSIELNTVASGLVWPLAPLRCDPVLLTLGTTVVAPGQTLPLHGSGFKPGEVVAISPPNSAAITIGTDGSGAFQINMPIPGAVTAGLHHVFVQGAQSGSFGIQVFYVAAATPAPRMSIVPNPVDRGTNLLVSGSGFAAHEQLQVFLGGGASDVVTTASASGTFGPTAVFVPATLSLGGHTVRVYGASSHRTVVLGVTIAPLVLPTATPSPTAVPPTPVPPTPAPHFISLAVTSSAIPGGRIVISGGGFAPGELALIRFNNAVVETVRTNSAGAFTNAAFILPAVLNPGHYTVTATGVTSGAVGQAFITVNRPPPVVTARLALSAGTVSPGAHLTAAGRGFEVKETILLRL